MPRITIYPHNCGHVTILSHVETTEIESEALEKKASFLDVNQCESCRKKIRIEVPAVIYKKKLV